MNSPAPKECLCAYSGPAFICLQLYSVRKGRDYFSRMPNAIRIKGQHKRNGTQHWAAKLKKRQVLNIRRELYAGTAGSTLATKYGVTKKTIYRIRDGKAYRDV